MTPPAHSRAAAFTLVELAMTALLLSIGILTVFALLRRGVASRTDTEEEIRASHFARTAFSALRAHSDQITRETPSQADAQPPAKTDASAWEQFWQDFRDSKTNLPLTRIPANISEDDKSNLSLRADDKNLGVYTNLQTTYYHCSVDLQNAFKQNSDPIDDSVRPFDNHPPNRALVTLHVWPGIATNLTPYTFFTIFPNPGRLP